jgi:hypothetical protein
MKTKYLKYTPALLMALFASSNASALSYGGSASNDHQQYIVDPNNSSLLIPNPDLNNPKASLSTILAGNAAAPGGNTELFASSDAMDNATYFGVPMVSPPYSGRTTLEVDFINSSSTLSLSSLTAADWGDIDSGGLLDKWTNDLFTAYAPGPLNTPANQTFFKGLFKAAEGEQQLSDPNISYIYTDTLTGETHIGLAGFLDASQANGLLPPTIPGLIPAGAQISEIVKVTDNLGQFTYLYAIGPNSATPSGLATADGSYDGNFDFIIAKNDPDLPNFDPGDGVDVPEPSDLALLVVGLTGFLGLRRKAVKS